jgi:tetratricopeptide (TPR) repeat protein
MGVVNPASGTRQSHSDASKPRVLLALGLAVLLAASLVWVIRAGRSSAAARDLRKAIAQGRAHLRQGRPDLAFQAVSDARDDEPGAGEAVALAASALIRMGQLRVARMALERALRINPDQFEATVTAAELNVDFGNLARGIELFEAATRLRPRESRVWLALARVLSLESDYRRAAEAYEKVLELDPKEPKAVSGVIRSWISAQEPGRAEPWLDEALRLEPDNPVILGLAARQAYDLRRFDESIRLADQALAADHRNIDALLARARALIGRSQWEKALPDAERAVKEAPGDLETVQLLLMIETRLGLKDRAAETLHRRTRIQELVRMTSQLTAEIEERPDDAGLRTRLGQVALESGSPSLAMRCFEAALALDPNDRQARESLKTLRGVHQGGARSIDN